MTPFRAACAACLLHSALAAAAEITPVKGDAVKGDVVSVSDTQVVFKVGDKTQTRPVKEILKIDFRDQAKPTPGASYAIVELTDGSQLFASKWLMRKKDVEMTLLTGQALKVPAAVVASVLNDAEVEANRRDWKSRVVKSAGREAIVVANKTGTTVSTIDATLGEGDDTGESITVAAAVGGTTRTVTRKLKSLRGVIFKNVLDPKAPPAALKLLDTAQGFVMVATLSAKGGEVSVTTPAGAKIDLKDEQVARLDYTKGRLEYLSDLIPVKYRDDSNVRERDDDKWYLFRDTNIDHRGLVVGGSAYAKGLALVPHVELTYDLKGEYREFEAVAGFDGGVKSANVVVLTIEGDGKELARLEVSPKDKTAAHNVLLNVKDVQRLRLVLQTDFFLDTAHLDLADAKVRKE